MNAANLTTLNLLMVDDDEFILKMGVRSMHSLGYTNIFTAGNGRAALERIDRPDNPIDIVLCDLNMPEMDGIELLRHLSTRRFAGGIVLISGENPRILKTAVELAACHKLYVLGSIEKPLRADALQALLARFVEEAPRHNFAVADAIAESELRHGLEVQELVPYFQPKIALTSRRVVGVEALIRWQSASRGMVFPDQFIPLAESEGLIDMLTTCMLDMAMQQGSRWRAQGLDLKVAINISMDNLHRLDFPELVAAKAAEHGMPLENLLLEVTESRLMADRTSALDILTRLRLKRIDLSIDDFGTGYSSLEQLQAIPFTELKIDRLFVQGASHDAAARAIFASSVALAKQLGMTVVAEGIETRDDWNLAQTLGCDLAQGYFIAKPMPADAVAPWVAAWETRKEQLL